MGLKLPVLRVDSCRAKRIFEESRESLRVAGEWIAFFDLLLRLIVRDHSGGRREEIELRQCRKGRDVSVFAGEIDRGALAR